MPRKLPCEAHSKVSSKKATWKDLRHGLDRGPKNNVTNGSKYCLVKVLVLPLRRREVTE